MLRLAAADPLGAQALDLLRLAAAEARALYPDQFAPGSPEPGNVPTPPRGLYLLAFTQDGAVGMAAHRPLSDTATELRRLYVHPAHRQRGVARALLFALEAHAAQAGFNVMQLETGERQLPAIGLYLACGYARIPRFGPYADDPTSVCFAKALVPAL